MSRSELMLSGPSLMKIKNNICSRINLWEIFAYNLHYTICQIGMDSIKSSDYYYCRRCFCTDLLRTARQVKNLLLRYANTMNRSSFIWLASVFCISYTLLILYLAWMHPGKNSTRHLHLTPLSFFAYLIDIFRALGISHARHWTWLEIESNAVKERKKEYTIQDFLLRRGYDDICLSYHCQDVNKSSRNELRKVKLPFDSFPIVWSQRSSMYKSEFLWW